MKKELTKEYLEDRFITKKWSYNQIYKESGWSKAIIGAALKKFGLSRRRSFKMIDFIGQTFGRLKVIQKEQAQNKCNLWLCQCECGNTTKVITGNLLSGNTLSCGCIKTESIGNKSKSWKGEGRISGRAWHMIQRSAISRGIYIDITIQYIWDLFLKQKEKCALTGWSIFLAKDSSQTASLDRIDSRKGYIEGNVQWLHKEVNIAKNTLTQDRFLEMCKSITENRK